MFVMVEIVGKKINDLFLLPREAVRENSSIYVVDSGKIEVRPVEILRRSGDQIYIKKGGSQGEKVVTRFPGVLSEGMTVRVRQVPFEKETPK
jgi:multidrug efflux pump subunit AcrA (membrane-fusion protein)